MALSDANKAGTLLFLAALQFAIFEFLASAVYPGYSVSSNHISDLGKSCSSCPSQTSWLVYDPSLILLGLMVIVAGYYIHRYFQWRPATGLILLSGLGATLTGLFNESAPYGLHDLFSSITFIGIGLTAIVGFWIQKPPLSYFSVIIGLASLAALILYIPGAGADFGASIGVGPGGLERLIVYPVLFWAIAFGGHLMGLGDKS